MELFQWGTDPWGQEILIRVSWDLLYLSFWAGVAFIIFHVIYSAVWLPKLAREASGGGGSAGVAGIPDRIERHSLKPGAAPLCGPVAPVRLQTAFWPPWALDSK